MSLSPPPLRNLILDLTNNVNSKLHESLVNIKSEYKLSLSQQSYYYFGCRWPNLCVCVSQHVQQILRTHPFQQLPFHKRRRQDFVTFLKPYSRISHGDLDFKNPDHVEDAVGYGRLICVFKFRKQVRKGLEVQEHHVTYMEEL